MLKLENIKIEYAKVLFEDVNLTLGNKEKVGLVGFNGCGKSTLMKIIAGLEKPTSGKVYLVNENVGYLPQVFDLTNKGEIEFIGEYLEYVVSTQGVESWKVAKILNKLDFGDYDEFTPLKTLSPGMKMKLYLASLLLADPTVLLLDEPTNHLDLGGIEWLENFISNFNGICIIISHDREFLNNTVTDIVEIDSGHLYAYKGNYDDFIRGKIERLEKQAVQYTQQEKRREKLEDLIELTKRQSSGVKQSKRLSNARKRLDREVLKGEIAEYKESKIKDFELKGEVHDSKQILEISDLGFGYVPENTLLKDINLEIFGSERIWLKGNNGTGKSTLIKLLTSELQPAKGYVKWGDNLRWKYFAQNQTEMDIEDTVQEYFFSQTGVDWGKSYGILSKFMFDRDLRGAKVKDLSPGQKSRLSFAIFAQQEYECLIMDEPTNHLDIETKETIEESLRNFGGAIILVSHDRYFAQQLELDRVFTIEEKRLVEIK